MSRPLRLEFAGALYHATSRGNEKKPVYLDNADYELFLALMAEVCERFNWVIHAYCLMTNHYHLVAETSDSNLSRGMRHLNELKKGSGYITEKVTCPPFLLLHVVLNKKN